MAVQDKVPNKVIKVPKGGEANLVDLPVLDTLQTSIQEMPPQGPDKSVGANVSPPETKVPVNIPPPVDLATEKAHKIHQAHFILSMALNLALRF